MTFLKSAALAAVLGMTATAGFAQDVTLRFQHFVSPNSANPKYFIEPWAKKVEAESNGRIKIEIYPFMQLGGKAPAQYDLIRDGAIDGGWVIPGYQPGRFAEAEALELPFMVTKSAEEASKAAWVFTQKYLADDFADVHLIAAHMHGRGLVHKIGPAVETVEDFDGLKLRGPSRAATLLLDKLGATPVGMPVPAFPEALSKGVVDGGVITWEMSPSLKLDELTDSHTDVAGDMSLYNLYFIWAMNKSVYEGLPDDLRAIIDANSGFETSAWAGRAHDTGDADGKALMAASGNEIAEISEEETAKIKALGEEVVQDWIAEMNARGLDGAQLVLDAQAAVAETRGTVSTN
ncbi:TRAP transporter substrate-binding protein [Pseudoprimorskyibacter insulae]|uniref:Solute-binding protein n=1 Tax=Pseudoprimorskyibacter insulae TaxID=1695997 RepID=A0A2R8ANB5_9RHOB|nr:TRAP transporter substrate-binding protein [Pseudoprimorskyibacter insulae]SPF77525.1 Solute-binding protein [Pseudoprimorskyibacter insulae]